MESGLCMDGEEEIMRYLKNWTEITKGLYRYVITANVCYEMHLASWYHNTDIMSANTHLYIVGDWRDGKESYFERELLHTGPLSSCIEAAIEDDLQNNNAPG